MQRIIQLNERQVELVSLIASGLTTDQAADKVNLQRQSAYNILSLARNKVGANTMPHLVAICLEKGLIEQDGEGFSPAA